MTKLSAVSPGSSRSNVAPFQRRVPCSPTFVGVRNAEVATSVRLPGSAELTGPERALYREILDSGAPEAHTLAALLCRKLRAAKSPAARAEIHAVFADALAARGQHASVISALGLNALHAALDRAGWATLTHALPSVAVLAACSQLIRGGSWNQIVAALPSLAALLPSLRHFAQFDQLVASLPDALRDSLAALHAWVEQTDAALVPRLQVAPATALVVTALLWHLQGTLPRPQAPLQGIAAFIAGLPRHWQRLASANAAGGALLAPVTLPPVPRQLTFVRSGAAEIAPGPLLPLDAAVPQVVGDAGMTSGAGRPGDTSLMAGAAGIVVSGLALVWQGLRMMSAGSAEPAVEAAAGPLLPRVEPPPVPPHVKAMIRMLDDIVEVDAMRAGDESSVWHALRAAVRGNRTGSMAPADWVALQLWANGVDEEVVAHEPPQAPTSVRSPELLRRRRSAGASPSGQGLPRAAAPLDVTEQRLLQIASQELVDAALALPPGPTDPEDLIAGNHDQVALNQARVNLRRWMEGLHNAGHAPATTLMTALRWVGTSDVRLQLVADWLPRLDKRIAAALTQNIKGITGNTVDPTRIFRNTFAASSPWPEWARRQRRFNPEKFRGVPPTARVYSTLLSSNTLVEAAVLAPETDPTRTVLQFNGTAQLCLPADLCSSVSLEEFNRANDGLDHMGGFLDQLNDFINGCRRPGPQPERDAYVDAMRKRLAGAGTLLVAMGQMGGAGKWLLDSLLKHPTRFGVGPGPLGRALAMPGQDIQVTTLVARPPGQGDVPLQGLLLATSAPSVERPSGAVLLIAPLRQPVVEEFASTGEALRQVGRELPQRLHAWVAVDHHAQWGGGNGPLHRGASVDADLLQELFFHQLSLRRSQLQHAGTGSHAAAQARKDYLALDQRLLTLPAAVPLPMLVAARERLDPTLVDLYSPEGEQWLAQAGMLPAIVLRHVDVEGARWLANLGSRHSLVKGTYPLASRYVAAQLEAALLTAHGVAIDAEEWSLVLFSGGTPSTASFSGFVHDAAQKLADCPLVECALTRAKGFPDGAPGSATLGIYSDPAATAFDADTELADLLPGQLIATLRGLDLRSGYLDALNDFWRQRRSDVVACVRSVYMSSAWQQFGEGSLTPEGLDVAVAATGYLLPRQAEDPSFTVRMSDGAQVSWVSLYGARSTLMRISNAAHPEVLLYSPGDPVAFREFADGAQLDAWLTRVVGDEQGRSWLNASFDLADLQDGWFSNGVGSALETAQAELFQGDAASLAIQGKDLFDAMVSRLQIHTLRDAETLFVSNWEIWRDQLQRVLQDVDLALGIASLVFPGLLPVVAVVAVVGGAEAALGVEQAIDGRTQAVRRQGAVNAGFGLFGVALSAPFAVAGTAARDAADGLRATGPVQAVAEAGAADPLHALSARYAQPASLVVEGARPADNGVYHYLGRHYIRQAGTTYEVVLDKANRTWRLKNPSPANLYQDPVRLNPDGLWEPHSDVGLRGGAPNSGADMRNLEVNYRRALQAEQSPQGASLLSSARADFDWGRMHPGRVIVPDTARASVTLQEMKELFVSGRLEQVQRGALSTVIAWAERSERLESVVRMEEEVREAVHFNGGHLYTVSQSLLDSRSGRSMGWCTGLSRIMAVAIAQHEELALVANLREAMRLPEQGMGAEFLSHVRDAQGVALLPGAVSAQTRIGFDELGRFLSGLKQEGVFILTGSQHSMVLAKQSAGDGKWLHLLYDPNLGLMQFRNVNKFGRWMRQLFSSRYFSNLQRASSGQSGETLAEMYGATRPGALGEPTLFMIRQVDTAKFLQQARQRGWTRLLEQVPA